MQRRRVRAGAVLAGLILLGIAVLAVYVLVQRLFDVDSGVGALVPPAR